MRWWLIFVALLAAVPSQAQNSVLKTRCVSCHSGIKPAAGLDLSRSDTLRQSAARIARVVDSGQMPPSGKLPAAELTLLKKSLPVTAPLWSLKPLASPLKQQAGEIIDKLVRVQLTKRGLKPSPPADKRTLIRRVTVDLTGLPPTPSEIAAFVADTRPDAYEKLVDRLLTSPAYGEKWARHWLDVVRFGESNGYERNLLRENAWPYRDWVVSALNADLPYSTFVQAQLAGEQLGQPAATGFLVAGVHDDVPSPDEVLTRQQRASDLDDMVATTAETFLGLTVGCARCHDHKFDPIPQSDYYKLSAVFAGVYHGERELEPQAKTIDRQRPYQDALWEIRNLARAEQTLTTLGNEDTFPPTYAKFVRFHILSTKDGAEPCLDELAIYGPESGENLALNGKPTASSLLPSYPIHQVAHLTDGWLGNEFSWISNEPGKGWVQVELPHETTISRVTWGRDASGRVGDRLPATYKIEVSEDGERWRTVSSHELRGTEQLAYKDRDTLLRKASERRDGKRAYLGKLVAPEPVYLLQRGDVMQRIAEVKPGVLTAVAAPLPPSGFAKGEARLIFAQWLVRRENPLTWRVIVNRIWQQHFGVGLVATPSDFGNNGAKPSNPELLDALAGWFQGSGQSFKKLHKLIVTSATYKQSAVTLQPKATALDSNNHLLWRGPLRRMESEGLWDAVLATSGTLDRTLGGPPYRLFTYKQENIAFYGPVTSYGPETWRRSLYRMAVRAVRDNLLASFDCPESAQRAPKRETTTTPLQALSLLNGPFIREQATHFAQRIAKEVGSPPDKQITHAFRLALGRSPRLDELSLARPLVAKDGLPALCRVLFNAHEFLYY